MELTYTEKNGLQYPNVQMKGQISEPLTKYGLMAKDFLEKQHPVRFDIMLMNGTLYSHCKEVEQQLKQQMDLQIAQMKAQTPHSQWQTRIAEIESELIRELILRR